MKYTIRLPAESTRLLREMADDAGVTVSDLIEVSVYNLIACYIKDKAPKEQPEDAEIILESPTADDVPADVGVVGVRNPHL